MLTKIVFFMVMTSALVDSVVTSSDFRGGRRKNQRCEKVAVKHCASIGYQFTDTELSPEEIFGQQHAGEVIDHYERLLKSGCAEEMLLLVCAVYVPICIPNYQEYLPPCRFICERAKAGCLPLIDKYKYQWPPAFNCSNFPQLTKDNQMCFHNNDKKPPSTILNKMEETNTTTTTTTTPSTTTVNNMVPTTTTRQAEEVTTTTTTERPTTTTVITTTTHNTSLVSRGCRCQCNAPMVRLHDPTHPLYNQITTGSVENCLMSCHSPYFSEKSQKLVVSWIGVWAVVCLCVTLLTVCSYLIDNQKFDYSERPIVYIAICYLFISIGYIIRLAVGHEAISCGTIGTEEYSYQHNLSSFLCGLIFFLTYFFFMAATLWWVLLSFTWFLLIGFRASGRIWEYLRYYHILVWGICTIKCIIIFGMSGIDGDPLSGICSVGAQNVENLKIFVVIPLIIYLTLATSFLTFGLFHFFSIKVALLPTIKENGEKRVVMTSEKLVERVGLFLLLYLVPTFVLLACYLYEIFNRHKWASHYNCNICHHDNNNGHHDNNNNTTTIMPEVTVFIIKFSATFLIGIGNGVWLFSSANSCNQLQMCQAPTSDDDDAASDVSTPQPPHEEPPSPAPTPTPAQINAANTAAEEGSMTSDSDVASYCDVCDDRCHPPPPRAHPCPCMLTSATSGDDDDVMMMMMTSRSGSTSGSECCCQHLHPPSMVDEDDDDGDETDSLVKLPPGAKNSKINFVNSCV